MFSLSFTHEAKRDYPQWTNNIVRSAEKLARGQMQTDRDAGFLVEM